MRIMGVVQGSRFAVEGMAGSRFATLNMPDHANLKNGASVYITY